MEKKAEFFRMFHWLLIAVFFYAVAGILASQGTDFFPQVQTVTWKLGHETIAAFVGYWIDRTAFRNRITNDSVPLLQIRRAMVIAAAMIAVSLGM